ncbi:hypothetical protein CL3_18630 [butyrate-producing bacterium SM4/1]|nr:hypothetical protein CLS_18090 [[Clostridium] cf. saccharolyticum K10]CBL36328.1 hypothetical protein CL3_18630 [butyrate-producing bacterium SM4/1]
MGEDIQAGRGNEK